MASADVRKRKFAQAVYAGSDQREAAVAAGYADGPGAKAQASKLMRDRVVRDELARLNARGAAAAHATRDEFMGQMTAIVRVNPEDFVKLGAAGPQIDLEKARRAGALKHIAGLSIRTDEFGPHTKIEWVDKLSAWDRLAKLMGWYAPEKHEHKIEGLAELSDEELLRKAKELGILGG